MKNLIVFVSLLGFLNTAQARFKNEIALHCVSEDGPELLLQLKDAAGIAAFSDKAGAESLTLVSENQVGFKNISQYVSSKAAQFTLTRSLVFSDSLRNCKTRLGCDSTTTYEYAVAYSENGGNAAIYNCTATN